MKAEIWGCRGTLPAPGAATVRYGGNTSCIAIETAEGRLVILDCGSGIRLLGNALMPNPPAEIDILLTHMHLDHVTGLGFFAPLFTDTTVRVCGPHLGDRSLEACIDAYLSPPLFPVRYADIPARIEVTEVRDAEVGRRRADRYRRPVQHPGGALGYPPRGRAGDARIHPRQRARPRTRTRASSSQPAPTSSFTTRSTPPTSIRARWGGGTRRCPTSPRSCAAPSRAGIHVPPRPDSRRRDARGRCATRRRGSRAGRSSWPPKGSSSMSGEGSSFVIAFLTRISGDQNEEEWDGTDNR